MATRKLGNWLKSYLEYTGELESPDSYHTWIGLSIIASTVRRSIFLDQGVYPLYPNQFIILVGPSRKMGKSTAIRAGAKLLPADIKIAKDSLTREKLIQNMAKISRPGKVTAMTLHSKELSSLIKPSGITMVEFLTDIYDCEWDPKGWGYETKTMGSDMIRNPVLNLLGGTTIKWLATEFPVEITEHGFTGRTIFVYEDELRKLNPFPTTFNKRLEECLKADLEHLKSMEGTFDWDPEARMLYEELYRGVADEPPGDFRLESFRWSKAKVHLLKLAMLISLTHSDDLVIQEYDIITAWRYIQEIEERLPKVFSAVGRNPLASDTERIYEHIAASGGLEEDFIIGSNYASGTAEDIHSVLASLSGMGAVKRTQNGKQIYWKPTSKASSLGRYLSLRRQRTRGDA